MISTPEFIFKDIEDVYIRENFKRLALFLQKFPLFRGEWQFFEVTFTAAVTDFKIAHGLGFTPTDIILTATKGAGSVGAGVITFNYDSFDKTNINVTTTDSCVVRFFAGSYKEESSRTGR